MEGDTYIIGDVHGTVRQLKKLLKLIRPNKNDMIVFTGDYIDRGPDSKSVISFILDLAQNFKVITLKGNHEEWFIDTMNDFTKTSWFVSMDGYSTVKSYSKEAAEIIADEIKKNYYKKIFKDKIISYNYNLFFDLMPKSHKYFFYNLINYVEINNNLIVHGSMNPDIDIEVTDKRIIMWDNILSIIDKKIKYDSVIAGHLPTFKINAELRGKVFNYNNKLFGIDTGVVETGVLCAIRLSDKKVYYAEG